MQWKRIAGGDYESADGRLRLYRLLGVSPPAWNVEDLGAERLLVDGAASKRDATALVEFSERARCGREYGLTGGKNMAYSVTCSKCGKSFSSAADFHAHAQVGYPCGPKPR